MAEAESLTDELLQQKHRKERKELQARIQVLKHSVPKGDKKKKKEISTEIARLEADLDKKQGDELASLTQELRDGKLMTEKPSENIKDNVEGVLTENDIPEKQEPKISKAQRRKEKKVAKEKERLENIEQEDANYKHTHRSVEEEKFKILLDQKNLSIKEITSDGHCLYNAVLDQLTTVGVESSLEKLRRQTADYMKTHPDDFLPFLTKPTNGVQYLPEEYKVYCEKIATTTMWGGQPEIKAMSEIYERPIKVFQADGPVITIGEEYIEKPALRLSYHRHIYRMGEHYNSIVDKLLEDAQINS